jgi:hypothetical protein
MAQYARQQAPHFSVIDRNTINASWTGAPTTLQPNNNVNLPQTPNGTAIFAYFNQSKMNNQGTLSLTSGGSTPQFLPVPALANQPSILINNWQANNLSVTNVSPTGTNTPIWISLVGPGLPGQVCVPLVPGNPAVQLAVGQCAQGTALPRYMQLIFQANSGSLTIFPFIGGPTDASGNNGYVIAVNAAANTGPGTGMQPPPGYYATTTSNIYTYQFNWGSATIFVSNLSPATAVGASVQLVQL